MWIGEVLLHTVDQALERAIAAAGQREREGPSPPDLSPATAEAAAWQQDVRRLQERCAGLHAVAHQAEQRVADVDAGLREEEAALRQWLAAIALSRQKLAEGGRPKYD